MVHTVFDVIHKLPRDFNITAIVLFLLFCIVLLCHLIEFPFLELCFCFDTVDFLCQRKELRSTICLTCSGVKPGDLGWRVTWAGGVVSLLAMMLSLDDRQLDDGQENWRGDFQKVNDVIVG
jgi:hypothetical protein